MKRRKFVQAIVSAVAVPRLLLGQNANPAPPLPAPVPWTLGLNDKTPIPKAAVADALAEGDLYFFTPAQMATLTYLCDIFVPPLDSKPGAIEAEVPAFLDFLIGSSPDDRKTLYQGGLDWLDAQSKSQLSKPFAKLTTTQADRILKPMMRTWLSDHPPTETHVDFINIAHADIRSATVNSKRWSEAPANIALEPPPKGLYWYPIDPDLRAPNARNTRISTRIPRPPA